ncbi:MAG: hypothetical protein V3V84_08800 [Candidatus Bathyarchaeia archaeon]
MNEQTKPSNTKKSNAVIQDRLDHVITLLARGLKRAQILVDAEVVSWRMANSSIDKYLQKAKGEIVENSQQARSEHLGRSVMNLDYLYKISLDKTTDDDGRVVSDPLPAIRVCLDIQKEKNRLLQLSKVYDPRGPADIPEELLPDEVHKLLDDVKIVNPPPPREIDLDAEFGKNLIAGSTK